MPSHGSLWVKHPHHPGGATKISWQPPPVQFEVNLPPADLPLDQSLVLEQAVQQSVFKLQQYLIETLNTHIAAIQSAPYSFTKKQASEAHAPVVQAMPMGWVPSGSAVAPVTGAMILDPILRAIPALRTTQACCPADNCPLGATVKQRLDKVIIHLNDNHAWPREDIADWLDTLDVDLSFQQPETLGSGSKPNFEAFDNFLQKHGLSASSSFTSEAAKAMLNVHQDASGNWAVSVNKAALPGPLSESPGAATTDHPSTETGGGGDT